MRQPALWQRLMVSSSHEAVSENTQEIPVCWHKE